MKKLILGLVAAALLGTATPRASADTITAISYLTSAVNYASVAYTDTPTDSVYQTYLELSIGLNYASYYGPNDLSVAAYWTNWGYMDAYINYTSTMDGNSYLAYNYGYAAFYYLVGVAGGSPTDGTGGGGNNYYYGDAASDLLFSYVSMAAAGSSSDYNFTDTNAANAYYYLVYAYGAIGYGDPSDAAQYALLGYQYAFTYYLTSGSTDAYNAYYFGWLGYNALTYPGSNSTLLYLENAQSFAASANFSDPTSRYAQTSLNYATSALHAAQAGNVSVAQNDAYYAAIFAFYEYSNTTDPNVRSYAAAAYLYAYYAYYYL